MSDSGILGERVRITRSGRLAQHAGEVVAIYATRKGPSYRILIAVGRNEFETFSFKRHEFELCKPWNILQTKLEV